MASQNTVFACWHDFIQGKAINPTDIPEHVLRGWELCREQNVDPFASTAVEFLTIPKLQQHIQSNAAFLKAAESTIHMLEISTRLAPAITILASRDNIILHVVGDNSALGNEEMAHNVPGCICNVQQVGTRAISLCMTQDKPVSLRGPEHYCKTFHRSACYAAPIHNPQGHVIGSIGVSGLDSEYHVHTLALVTAAANAIDSRLREVTLQKSQVRLNSLLNAIYNALPEASLTINNQGLVTHANAKGLRLLNTNEADMIGKAVIDLVRADCKQAFIAFLNKKQKASCEVHFINAKDQSSCLCRLHPVKCDDGTMSGFAMTITTRRQLLDIASQLGGNYAVYTFDHIIGDTPAVRECIELANKVAPTTSRVLLVGESGTGKELFAQAIHNNSLVCNGPFVAISCGAIPRDLVEAEFFGYVAGAFTGANKNGAIGKFELASRGTLFLDEINSLPLDMQSKLLRAIQQGEILKLGDSKPIKVKTRIIAATNKDLKQAIKENTFREDLYYRLNVVEIAIPPLRDRRGDIASLAQHFITKLSQEHDVSKLSIEKEFLAQLEQYSWPGNIRELCNVCERAIILAGGKALSAEFLPLAVRADNAEQHRNDVLGDAFNDVSDNFSDPSLGGFLGDSLDTSVDSLSIAFWYLYKKSMATHKNNISLVAKELGISRSTLYRKIKQMNEKCSPNIG